MVRGLEWRAQGRLVPIVRTLGPGHISVDGRGLYETILMDGSSPFQGNIILVFLGEERTYFFLSLPLLGPCSSSSMDCSAPGELFLGFAASLLDI